MAAPSSLYLKHEIAIKDLAGEPHGNLGSKCWFVGIDMAPISTLETGIAVLDRDRNLMRMEKLSTDEQLLDFITRLGAPENIVVALDIPKSLSIPSKWRQQQIKMHPLRLRTEEEGVTPTDRFAPRAIEFYDTLAERGMLIVNYFTAHAKLRYDLSIPYRSRSPQGCRASQALIQRHLGIQELPNNLAPSSVLDAMIGAYTAWSLCFGEDGRHFKLFRDDEARLYLDPLERVQTTPKKSRSSAGRSTGRSYGRRR